ncbi:50S ribosomal protein L24 [archaeon]|jgi:large subunit ribosomal protein L24|nr:50S ribosomal protein L24 [archaeon]
MKAKFSTHWTGSKQPRKQRKFRANAPLHVRHKMVSAHLSETLRKRYGKRNVPIRKGDNVKIMKGEFKGKTGKIDDVNLKKLRVMIEGIFRTKKDGTKVSVYFNPSNLLIKELNLDDEKRKKALERKGNVKVVKVEKKKEFKAKPLPVEKKKDESKSVEKKK